MRSAFIVLVLILVAQFNYSLQQQLTQQQQDLMHQYQSQITSAFSNLSSVSGGQYNITYTGSMTNDQPQMSEQQLEQFFSNFENLGIPIGENGLDPSELDASRFTNKQQFYEILNNLTNLVKQLGLETNQTKLDSMKAELEKAFNAQIQAQLNLTQIAQANFKQQMYGQTSPPPQFQNIQNLISQYQKQGDTQGLQDVQLRMQAAQQQQLQLQGKLAQMQQNVQNFQQKMQNIGQQGNPQQFIDAMQQFRQESGQLTGDNFRQVAQKLQQSNVFSNVTNANDAKNLISQLAKMSKQQGDVDILAQTNTNDTDGVGLAQKAMDQMRLEGQQKLAFLMQQGGDSSQFLSDANMFFQQFQPGNVSSQMQISAGSGQPKMTLPADFMQKALKGLSNVVAQISQIDPGEWDSVDDISQFALSKIVDIKFFSNDSQVAVSGLSSTEKITFCAPLVDQTITTCADFKCGYIDPNSQTLKYDGVSLVNDAISQLSDGTLCCECEASHTTSFAVVSSSANAAKLMISALGLLLAILTFFFA